MEENNNSRNESWNQPTYEQRPEYMQDNKKVLAGLMALLFGYLGIHKFVLGYTNEGIILLVLSLIGFATSCLVVGIFILIPISIISFVEGIIYLTKSDRDFYEIYQKNKRPWF